MMCFRHIATLINDWAHLIAIQYQHLPFMPSLACLFSSLLTDFNRSNLQFELSLIIIIARLPFAIAP